jgi:hypothetical protein
LGRRAAQWVGVDSVLAATVPQLHHGARSQVSAVPDARQGKDARKLRIRHAALGLATLALAFYFGFIALLVFRSHH